VREGARGAYPASGRKQGRLSQEEAASLFPADWERRSYLAFDVETTGLDSKTCRVVEIGAVLFVPESEVFDGPSMERLINPGMPIPPAVIAIHGIGDADVRSAPSFSAVARDFAALAEGAIFVAHNAPFDLGFIRGEFARAGLLPPTNPAMDSLVLARAAFPGLSSYSLPRLLPSLGIRSERSHRALDDAIAAARVFVEAGRRLTGLANRQKV